MVFILKQVRLAKCDAVTFQHLDVFLFECPLAMVLEFALMSRRVSETPRVGDRFANKWIWSGILICGLTPAATCGCGFAAAF